MSATGVERVEEQQPAPALPQVVAEPALPQAVAEPALPQVVAEPALPQAVAEPALPQAVAEPAGSPAAAVASESCQNCKTPLTGHYCYNCGQRHEPHVHSMREFAGEAFESVTHADSRLWRTLWLLIAKPGFLTREFIEGRRARYLPPFRLYLVLSVVMFLGISLISRSGTSEIELDPADAEEIANAAGAKVITPRPGETAEERARRVCESGEFNVPEASLPRFEAGCRKVVVDNGQAFGAAMMHNVPRALFLMIPLLALVMQAMYWRRYYVEHLLFFIHNHAFDFVLFTVVLGLLAVIDSGWVTTVGVLTLMIYPPIYTYRAIRRVYPQNRWIARLKFVGLAVAYFVVILVLATATSMWSLLTL